MGVKKSAVCRSRPPPNGMNPASSRVSKLLTKPSAGPGASPLSACSRSPGANLEAQPAFVEYFVNLMRVRSSIAAEYTPVLLRGLMSGGDPPGSPPTRHDLSALLYAQRICHLADVTASECLHYYVCGQNQCQVEAKSSAPYGWAPRGKGSQWCNRLLKDHIVIQ